MENFNSFDTGESSDITPKDFLLDDRCVLIHLEYIKEYLSQVPYRLDGFDSQSHLKNWAEFFFMEGGTPEQLAAVYDGQLESKGLLLPHQAFLLTTLKMLDIPRRIMNMFPSLHRDLYYRELLKLKEETAKPSSTAVSITLDDSSSELMLPVGTLFDAGQDNKGNRIEFAFDSDLLVNQSYLSDIRWFSPCGNDADTDTTAVIFNSNNVLPNHGVRLFSSVKQDTKVTTGQVIVSPVFLSLGGENVSITFQNEIKVSGLSLQISGEGEWHSIDIDSSTTDSISFTVPESIEISNPQNLSNLTFSEPVIRLIQVDKTVVPPVSSITINNETLTKERYYTRVLTPFGHSDSFQRIDKNELYLGVNKIYPGQTLSLFFNLNTPQPLDVCWKYLATDNSWYKLDEVLFDGTKGLLNSGIVSVVLPGNASDEATAMPAGCYWIKAEIEPVIESADNGIADYPWLTGVLTNAMTATLKNGDIVDAQSVMPLPAGAIRYLLRDTPGVKMISQPWDSWGGKAQESSLVFMDRVAQRLSHRNRALSWPDMVTLLKAMFPDVYDVMIPSQSRLSSVPALTTQTLVVMPLATKKDNDDPQRPVFNAARLMGMQNVLQQHGSLWQQIVVKNPEYRNVSLSYHVVFRNGVNKDWAEQALRKEIISSFIPWSAGKMAAATLANRIDYYQVVDTLQRQTYVDHVVNVTLDGHKHSITGKDDEVLILCLPSNDK